MSGNWLVLWAGADAAWGRLDADGPFGPHVETGSVLSTLALSSDAARGLAKPEELREGEVAFDITSELDAAGYASGCAPMDAPAVEIVTPSTPAPARPLFVAEGAALVRAASDHVRRQLGGVRGVLGVPGQWLQHRWRRALLDGWESAGWTVVPWETAANRESAGRRSMSLAAGGWARVVEAPVSMLLPTSAESAAAAALAPVVRARLLGLLDSAHGETLAETARETWFTDGRLRTLLADALTRRLDHLVAGGETARIFGFPTTRVGERHVALASVRMRIALPRLKDSDWWSDLARPGMLKAPPGSPELSAPNWGAQPTVFFGARPAERRLHLSFEMNGWPSALVTPPTMRMFGVGGPQVARPPVSASPPIVPPSRPPPPLIEDVAAALAVYRAGSFRLRHPHRAVRARVNHEPRPVGRHVGGDAGAVSEYRVEIDVLPQGALLRVDYEPEPEA